MNLKEIPLGIKVIIIYLLIVIVVRLRSLVISSKEPNLFLGLFVQPPISIVLNIILLIIPLLILFLILKKLGWKLILGLQSFNLLNGLIGAIVILMTPFTELANKMNRELPNASPEVLEAASFQSKLIVSIPMFIGIIIAVIILVYIYKKKEYFSKE